MNPFDSIIKENGRDYNNWVKTLNDFAEAVERIGYKTTIRWFEYGDEDTFPIREITEDHLKECWDLSVFGPNDEGPCAWTWLNYEPTPSEDDRFWSNDTDSH